MLTLVAIAAAVIVAAAVGLWTPDKAKSALEPRYLAAPTDYVDIGDLRLHVRDSGPRSAPAVILLHGLGASLHTWEPWAEDLATLVRVVRYDLPGAGLTGADPTGDYTDVRGMAVLAALMDRLGLRRASLIGNSMGGRLAWRFAAQYPDRVDKLVLISPDGFESPGYAYGTAPVVPAALKLMRFVLPKSMLRSNLTPAYADETRLTADAVDRYYDLMLAPGVRDAMLQRMAQTVLVDPAPLLRRIAAPTLLLWGDRDAMIPVSNAADYLTSLPNARLVTLPGLGHVPHEEAPAQSLPPVRAFLGE